MYDLCLSLKFVRTLQHQFSTDFRRGCVNVSDSQADAMMRAQCEVLKKGEGDAVPLRALSSSPRPRDTTRATAPLSTDARKQRREKERHSARNLQKAIEAMKT